MGLNDELFKAYKSALQSGEKLQKSVIRGESINDVCKEDFLRGVKEFLEVNGCIDLAFYFAYILPIDYE